MFSRYENSLEFIFMNLFSLEIPKLLVALNKLLIVHDNIKVNTMMFRHFQFENSRGRPPIVGIVLLSLILIFSRMNMVNIRKN